MSRCPYEDANVDEDEDGELAEDSFITEITPDLFDTVTSLKQKKRRRQNRDLITSLEESDEVEDGSDFAVDMTQDTGSVDLSQQHDVAKLQRECPDYKPIFEYIEEGICHKRRKQQGR